MGTKEKRRLTDKEYKFIFSRAPRLCLDFVIVKGGRVLLAKRAIDPYKGKWHLPGGMVRREESLVEASGRIINSELGVRPFGNRLLGFMEFPDEVNKNGLHVHSVSLVFLTKIKDEKITKNDQSEEVNFFQNFPKNIHPVHGKFLKENRKLFTKQHQKNICNKKKF